MKANELMVGDWVNEGPFNVKVLEFDQRTMRYEYIDSAYADIRTDSRFLEDCKPIPLTEEILKANGFIVNTYQAYLIDGIFLDNGLDGNAYWWQIGHCSICAINYVHELQHAFRLCGLNELADNFIV